MQARRVNTASWLGALARPPQPELLAPHARCRLTSAPPLRLPTIATLLDTTRPNPAMYNTLCLQNPHKLICSGTVKPNRSTRRHRRLRKTSERTGSRGERAWRRRRARLPAAAAHRPPAESRDAATPKLSEYDGQRPPLQHICY